VFSDASIASIVEPNAIDLRRNQAAGPTHGGIFSVQPVPGHDLDTIPH